MIRSIMFILIILMGCTVSSHAQHFNYRKDYERIVQQSRQQNDSLYYPTLLPAFLRNDKNLSVYKMLALMIGYTGRSNYRPFDDLKIENIIYRLNDSAKYDTVIAICDTFLQQHPLNQLAIIEKSYAFHKLGKTDSAAFYKEQFGRIMAAMDWSAEGKSPDEAMFAIGPQDGLNFIDKYYHATPGRDGDAEDSEGNFCDMLEMKFKKDGKEQSLVFYFVIQHAINTTALKHKGTKTDKL